MSLFFVGLCSLFLVATLGACSTNSPTAEKKAPEKKSSGITLTVATFNLHAPKNHDHKAQAKLLLDNHVEIAGLQEVNYNNYRFSSKTKTNTLTGFKEAGFGTLEFAKTVDFAGGEYGIATVSTMKPLGATEVHQLVGTSNEKAAADLLSAYKAYRGDEPATVKAFNDLSKKYGKDYVEPRVYQRTMFEKDGKKIAFYNVHLSYENPEIRAKQIKQVIEAMKADKTEYKILTGDFNNDKVAEWKPFADAGYKYANGTNNTWHYTYRNVKKGPFSAKAIDNIFVTPNITIKSYKVPEIVSHDLSDHNPIIAVLELH